MKLVSLLTLAELLLLMDLALENPLELDARFPRPLDRSSWPIMPGSIVGEGMDVDLLKGLNLSINDRGCRLEAGGFEGLTTLGPGMKEGIPLVSVLTGDPFANFGIDLQGEGCVEGILGNP